MNGITNKCTIINITIFKILIIFVLFLNSALSNINELIPLEDSKILNIMKCNYLIYGIVTNEMIEKKENNYITSEKNDFKFFFKNPELINYNSEISEPDILFNNGLIFFGSKCSESILSNLTLTLFEIPPCINASSSDL